MTNSISAACRALVLFGLLVAPAAAQQAAPTHVASPVAILDLPYLFRNHQRFKQMDDVLKQEIGAAEQQFLGEQKALKDEAQRLGNGDFKPSSPEFKAAEESLAKKDADISLRVNIMRKNFAEKKAKNYFEVYQEVMAYVNYHARQSGVVLVLNFNGDPIDGSNPQSVIQGLNSTVLYKHPGVDITPVILDMCNRGVALPPEFQPGAAPAAQHGVPSQR
ncbi:MAG: OmpH family outer membrane protein [Pirellulales bacterium]